MCSRQPNTRRGVLCCAGCDGATGTGRCTGAASSTLVLLSADTPIADRGSSACACFIGSATDATPSAICLLSAWLLTSISALCCEPGESACCGAAATGVGRGAKSVSSSVITSSSARGRDGASCSPGAACEGRVSCGAACAVGDGAGAGDGAGSTASSSR